MRCGDAGAREMRARTVPVSIVKASAVSVTESGVAGAVVGPGARVSVAEIPGVAVRAWPDHLIEPSGQ